MGLRLLFKGSVARTRLSIFGAVLLAVLSCLPSSSAQARDGDVAPLGARNGVVSVADALIALRYALNLISPLPADDLFHGDVAPLVNGVPVPDGRITIADALVILRVALNLVTLPPAGPPTVAINSPNSLVTVGSTPLRVTGSIDGDVQSLTLNGVVVAPSGSEFIADVDIEEGLNTVVARAVSSAGDAATATISVSLDMTSPYLTIDSHQDGDTVYSDTITVTGLVNDIVRGTIENTQANVTVNGVAANISNRSYSLDGVVLAEGANTITVAASDQVGNLGSISIDITRVIPTGRRIEQISGDGQTDVINAVLANPLEVRVVDDAQQPVVNTSVIFRVAQGSGNVGAGTVDEGRGVVVSTDVNGEATTSFQLGIRAGTANHKVSANVVGYDDEVIFTASATGNIGNKISVNSGNNQRGAVGQVLPAPLVISVTDEGANVVAGARVRFDVQLGGGVFLSNGANSLEVQTDSDGRASAQFVLGALEGLDAQRVLVTLIDAPPGDPIYAGYLASAFVPADPGLTTVSGVVLDNQYVPIPGVTIRIDGTTRQAVADTAGQFVITDAPVGPVHLIVDGSTAAVEGEYPSLSYNLVTIAGVDNPMYAPIYMVKLDTDNTVYAGPADVSLELDKYPGFKLDIVKDSLTFPDGSREGLVSVTSVNASTIPMAPPNGMQPQFIVTIQPTGTKFDPPARLTLPNVDGHPPGAQAEMYSYDHDLEEFVTIGLGTVSEDGSLLVSNPGVGVIKAGWHCGSQPGQEGCAAHCEECKKCSGDCKSCVADPAQANNPLATQVEGDCLKKTCTAEVEDLADPPGACERCVAGGGVEDEPLLPDGHPVNNKCVRCILGVPVPDALRPAVTTSISLGLPSEVVSKINKGLEKLKDVGVDASVTVNTLTADFVDEECCDPIKGKDDKKTASIGGTIAKVDFRVRVFPGFGVPTPRFESGAWNIGIGRIKVGGLINGGIFLGVDSTFDGKLGYRKDACSNDTNDNNGCFFGELGINLEPKASVGMNGTVSGGYWRYFKDPEEDDASLGVSLSAEGAGEGRVKLSIAKVSYHGSNCSEGLKGGTLSYNGLTMTVFLKVDGKVEAFGLSANVNRKWEFLKCQSRPKFSCTQSIF